MALADLCRQLRSETGIRLEAGASVADEKVTLFCRAMPLREVMRQLSRPFGYTWLRSGKEGEYRYELVQDLRSQLLEEELRNRDRNAALLALEREVQRYRAYLDLTQNEARSRIDAAPPGDRPLLEHLADYRWGAIQMYFRLSPGDLAALRAGQEIIFRSDPRTGERPLSADMARDILRSFPDDRIVTGDGGAPEFSDAAKRPDGLPLTAVPEIGSMVRLWMTQEEPGRFVLWGEAGVTVQGRGLGRGSPIANGMNPVAHDPQNAAANARLARDPALRPTVSVLPQPSCGVDLSPGPSLGAPASRRHAAKMAALPGRADQLPLSASGRGSGGGVNRVTTAEVLEALHQATGLPIVADYYTRLFQPGDVSARNKTLFDALNQLADTMRLHWHKDGGWLQFRSAAYYDDRLKEVPNRLLERWAAARRQHGMLTLDDLIEIGQLPDAQLDASEMAEGARVCFGLAEWDLVCYKHMRPHIRFLASFTPAQRQQVITRQGLPFTKLTLAQQQQFISLTWVASQDGLKSLEDLAAAALRVDYRQPGWFEWRVPDVVSEEGRRPALEPSPARERTRSAALQAALRLDPQATEAQIVPVELDLMFVYTRRDGNTLHVQRIQADGKFGHTLPVP